MNKLISTDLTVVEPKTLLQLFNSDGGVDPLIAEAEAMATELMKDADVSTKKGRDAIASNAHKFSKLKTSVDGYRKESIADYNKIVKAVNANGKKVRDRCDELKQMIREPLNKWEAERDRKQAVIDEHLIYLKNAGLNHNDGTPLTLEQLQENKSALEKFEITEEVFAEYTDEAKEIGAASFDAVVHNIAIEEKRIADEEELNRLREAEAQREAEAKEKADAEEAERLAKERDDKIKADAIREQEEKYEREKQARLQAEEDARNAKAKAELEQEQKAQAEKEAIERAERDRRHVGNVRREAKEALMRIVDNEVACKEIVLCISNGGIPNVSISYAK